MTIQSFLNFIMSVLREYVGSSFFTVFFPLFTAFLVLVSCVKIFKYLLSLRKGAFG